MSTIPHKTYVMVPVPVEHQAELLSWVMGMIIRDAVLVWDLPATETLVQGVNPQERAFLHQLTVASSENRKAAVTEFGAALGIEPEEVVSLVHELNDRGQALGKTAFVILDDADPLHAFTAPHMANLLIEALGPP